MAVFSRFFGRTVGEGAGVAIGTATAKVVEPALQELANAAWEHDAHVPLDPKDAAAARAREPVGDLPGLPLGGVSPSHEARYSGLGQQRFDVLTELEREHPGLSELLELRRRRLAFGGDHGIGQEQFQEWLRRAGFSAEVIAEVTKLLTEYLSPADIANAVQQGFVPGDYLLAEPETGGQPFTPPTEQVPIDPSDEAAAHGIDRDRLKVLAELSGNPPGPAELLEMWRRGIISETAVDRGIREGRTKTKWTPALKALKQQLLTPAVLVNRYLRGWDSFDAYADKMALHGFNAQQAQDWYESAGRPAAPVQMQTAAARGVDGPDGRPMDREQFLKGIRESDIRPEWGPMLWGIRHAYPSLFQLRGAVQAGFIDRARALEILRFERYEDQDATALVNGWLSDRGTTAKGLTAAELTAEYEGLFIDRAAYLAGLQELGYPTAAAEARAHAADARRTKSYRDAAIRQVQRRYELHRSTEDEARASLAELRVPDEAAGLLLTVWGIARDEKVAVLTPAQVKKAWRKGLLTRAQAEAELDERGYEPDEARIYLDE